ncbi:hypothetical protein PVAND_002549 [Polypedilum vanderplanki]|uniref:Uncharacterized protein n=1 Tax=Polypedilum vanderplanki TaxID=319348 RepID=A0A9J6BSH6_POLVA|nr:hypothetical protein PVAND_002549 [Polypedilum vanderplanki]
MNLNKFIVILIFLFVIFHSSFGLEENNSTISFPKIRTKRHLFFQNGSRILVRFLVKDNIYKVNQIFAHGFGFRANIDILQPPIPHHYIARRSIQRREIYNTIEQMFKLQGFDGRACIFKIFCDTQSENYPEIGMFSKLLKLIFTHKEAEYEGVNTQKLSARECGILNKHCPISLLELSSYTDV